MNEYYEVFYFGGPYDGAVETLMSLAVGADEKVCLAHATRMCIHSYEGFHVPHVGNSQLCVYHAGAILRPDIVSQES